MFLIVLLLWAVVGFLVWIPMLVRSTLFFSGMLVLSSINRNIGLERARYALETSVTLYADGFQKILRSMKRSQAASSFEDHLITRDDVVILALNIAWIVGFYIIITFAVISFGSSTLNLFS